MSITPPSGHSFSHSAVNLTQSVQQNVRREGGTDSTIERHSLSVSQESSTSCGCCRFFQSIGAWIVWILTCGFCDFSPEKEEVPLASFSPQPLNPSVERVDLTPAYTSEASATQASLPPVSEPIESSVPSFSEQQYKDALEKILRELGKREIYDIEVDDRENAESVNKAAILELISGLITDQIATSEIDTFILILALYRARTLQLKCQFSGEPQPLKLFNS